MRKNHGWAAFWQKKQYIIAGTLVILAAVGMTVLYSRGQEQERKQLEQEIAAEMDTENQNVAMEEETEADQVASILKPQTQSTETAEVERRVRKQTVNRKRWHRQETLPRHSILLRKMASYGRWKEM